MVCEMRTLAIGDIHGCLRSLESLVHEVGLTSEDTLITLGDYVDRGPDTRGVIDFLLSLQDTHTLVPLRGNHEIGMLRALVDPRFAYSWLGPVWGGGATLNSYETDTLKDIPDRHWEFLNQTLPYHEAEEHIFVHANLDPELACEEQDDEVIFWQRFGDPQPHYSGKTMVCGHTPQAGGRPLSVGHAICVDTHVYDGGWLTCLEVESGQYWQANEDGEKRSGRLR